MTDVVVQHLITNQDIRIQCKDYVKKLAVYKGCLAVQLPKQITIYQLKLGADSDDMLYTPGMQPASCHSTAFDSVSGPPFMP